jgi:ubiquitin thioesterase OTU1
MRARLRAPGGASTVELADDATVGDLISKIVEKTSLSSFDIKYGYPPKPLLLNQSETSRPLKDLDIKLDGEQLTISQKEQPVVPQSSQSTTQGVATQRGQNIGSSHAPTSSKGAGREGSADPVSLQRKGMEGDVPELPLPDRGATLGRVSSLLCT